jgi:hypothetical protein
MGSGRIRRRPTFIRVTISIVVADGVDVAHLAAGDRGRLFRFDSPAGERSRGCFSKSGFRFPSEASPFIRAAMESRLRRTARGPFTVPRRERRILQRVITRT